MIWGVENAKKIAYSIFNTFDKNALSIVSKLFRKLTSQDWVHYSNSSIKDLISMKIHIELESFHKRKPKNQKTWVSSSSSSSSLFLFSLWKKKKSTSFYKQPKKQ